MEQFHPRIGRQYAGLRQAVIFFYAEAMLFLRQHEWKLTRHLGGGKPTLGATWAMSYIPKLLVI